MHTVEELRKIAICCNEKIAEAKQAALASALKQNIKLLEESIEKAAAGGFFSAESANLCNSAWRGRTRWTTDELRDALSTGLIDHFKPLGFTFAKCSSNYLTVKWE